MSRYEEMFKELKKKKEGALITFVTVGDPNAEQSGKIIQKLVDSGADALELGFAFSDPLADGPVIQAANQRALKAGMNVGKAIGIIAEIRKNNQSIPIGLLVYCNLVYNYGIEKFYKGIKAAGIDSVLIADLSLEESATYVSEAGKNGISQIFMVAPATTDKRLKLIVEKAEGFIYLVSVAGTTGARSEIGESTLRFIRKTRKATDLPLCVGFGISMPEHVSEVLSNGADGAIVGSAIGKLIEENLGKDGKMLSDIACFAEKLKAATKNKQ